MRGLFITGTDTDVGKTYVSSLILKTLRQQGRSVGAYKPACSGAINASESIAAAGDPPQVSQWADVEQLYAALDGNFSRELICPQRFQAPLAPPVAARLEQATVDEVLLTAGVDAWRALVEGLVIEGVGGWLCPLSNHATIADFAQFLGFPVLVVAAHRLGVINHTLLTLESIRRRGLPIAGVILNQVRPLQHDPPTQQVTTPDAVSDLLADNLLADNIEQICMFGNVDLIACCQYGQQSPLIAPRTGQPVDWWEFLA